MKSDATRLAEFAEAWFENRQTNLDERDTFILPSMKDDWYNYYSVFNFKRKDAP